MDWRVSRRAQVVRRPIGLTARACDEGAASFGREAKRSASVAAFVGAGPRPSDHLTSPRG